MSPINLLTTSLYFIFILLCLTSFGLLLITWVNKKKRIINPIEQIGLALLIGLGVFGNLALVLGLLGYFYRNFLLILLMLMLIVSIKKSFFYLVATKTEIKQSLTGMFNNISVLIITITTMSILGSLYLSAQRPPYTIDEIAYHFPQAMEISNNHKIYPTSLGGSFYGNIPKFMEIMFAVGISLSGFSLAHSINFMFLVGFSLFVFGYLYRNYNLQIATLSIFLFTLYDDFTWNATTGYVDSATSILEVSAILVLANALSKKTKNNYMLLGLSGALIGSSLAIKYSPLPTLFFLLATISLLTFLEKRGLTTILFKRLLFFSIPVVVFGGYVYIKNTILFSNPFYPLYFGHEGMSQIEYESLLNAIRQFRPKTLQTFIRLINEYKTVNGLTVYISFYIWFIVFLTSFITIKSKSIFNNYINITYLGKKKLETTILILFSFFYTLYWFFFATHQIRFLTSVILVNSILLSVFVFSMKKFLRIIIIKVAVFALVVVFLMYKGSVTTTLNNYFYSKFHVEERQYALGNETDSQFYYRRFGCKFEIIKYVKDNGLDGFIMDNWTPWLGGVWPMLPETSKFKSFISDKKNRELLNEAKFVGFNYIFIEPNVKERHKTYKDLVITNSRDKKLPSEEYLLKHANEIYKFDDCYLFKINF